jgi:2-polyprenyl-6-methoxyphenol hydroxylase-like FAD-dependent oxidoreductase
VAPGKALDDDAATVIVGAGFAGLATALLLARRGRRSVVLERDPAPSPATAEAMWAAWPRPSTPQARLGYALLPGLRRDLLLHLPEWRERVLALGAVEYEDPGDAAMVDVMSRRTTLEGALRLLAEVEPLVTVRAGQVASGLAVERGVRGVPRVVGVHTTAGESLPATRVVVASGRNTALGRWLDVIGVPRPEERSDPAGLLWYSRFRAIELEAGEGPQVAFELRFEGRVGSIEVQAWGADNATFCIEFGVPAWRRELRVLRQASVHDAACALLDEVAPWMARSRPIGDVAAMGQDRNAVGRFCRDGVPIVRGLHVLGDARAKTNNLYAWGIGLAVWQAIALVECIDQHPDDALCQAQAFEARVGEELELRHALAVRRDRARAAEHGGDEHYDGEPPVFRELDDAFETAFASVQDDDVALLFGRRENQVAPMAGDAADDDAFRAEVIRRARARPAPPAVPVFAVDEESLVEVIVATGRANPNE